MYASVPEIIEIRDGKTAQKPLHHRSVSGKEDGLLPVIGIFGQLRQKLRSARAKLSNGLPSLGRYIISRFFKKFKEIRVRNIVALPAAAIALIRPERNFFQPLFLNNRNFAFPSQNLGLFFLHI